MGRFGAVIRATRVGGARGERLGGVVAGRTRGSMTSVSRSSIARQLWADVLMATAGKAGAPVTAAAGRSKKSGAARPGLSPLARMGSEDTLLGVLPMGLGGGARVALEYSDGPSRRPRLRDRPVGCRWQRGGASPPQAWKEGNSGAVRMRQLAAEAGMEAAVTAAMTLLAAEAAGIVAEATAAGAEAAVGAGARTAGACRVAPCLA